MAKIVVAQGLEEQQSISLDKSLVSLGRSATCDIVLPNPVVSRVHAEIIEESGKYYLDDLNSRNGTLLNGTRVTKRSLLKDGDLIQVDEVVLQFSSKDSSLDPNSGDREPHEITDQTSHIITTLAVQDDLRLEQNAEYKLRAIAEISKSLAGSLDVDAVLPRLLDSLLEIFPKADRISVVLTKDNHQLIPYAIKSRNSDSEESATIAPISRTIIRRVLSEQIAILSSDVLTDNRFNKSASVLELGIQSMICAPLIGPSQQAVGVLMADVQELEEPFDERDLDVLVTVSQMVAQNMDYMRLHQAFIEERRQAETTLRQSNETLQTLISSSPLALFLLNRDGIVSRVWNPAATALFGWTPMQVFEQPLKIIAPPDQSRFDEFWESVSSGHRVTGVEIRCRTKSGDEVDIEFSAAPLPTDSEQISEVILIAADATELKKTREAMLQSERLVAIGETVASLTHESRNALNRIQLGAEILKESSNTSVDIRNIVNEIFQGCRDLQYLFEDVRQFGAPIRLEKKHCELDEIARRTWESVAAVREDHRATFQLQILKGDANCHVDPLRIEQVFRNMFENSIDVSKGRVQIDVTISSAHLDGSTRISVRDDGPGLTREQSQKIFDPFYTTKSTGTGLGMAIVKRIVEAHGGEIRVDQSDRPGAEFLITIPSGPPAET